jgi:hypothetical protein
VFQQSSIGCRPADHERFKRDPLSDRSWEERPRSWELTARELAILGDMELEELPWLKRRSILVEKRTTLGSPADAAYHKVLQLHALC